MRRKYRKKKDATVIAVQLDLATDGFSYRKWGAEQTCHAGDWIVNNNNEVYTVNSESFAETYKPVSPGIYYKEGTVWAERANQAGVVKTKEGETCYDVGVYLVSNNKDGTDGYAVERDKFEDMYELVDEVTEK